MPKRPGTSGVRDPHAGLQHRGPARLEDIFSYIAAANPDRARSHVGEIERVCEGLCTTPMIGRPRPEAGEAVRTIAFRRRVLIAYRARPDAVQIIRVLSAGRDYDVIMREG